MKNAIIKDYTQAKSQSHEYAAQLEETTGLSWHQATDRVVTHNGQAVLGWVSGAWASYGHTKLSVTKLGDEPETWQWRLELGEFDASRKSQIEGTSMQAYREALEELKFQVDHRIDRAKVTQEFVDRAVDALKKLETDADT